MGGDSSRTTVATPSAEADADVENSPEWTYVQNWRPNPNVHPHGWVRVDVAGSMQGRRYEVATPAGRLILNNEEYREVARRVLHARNIMGGVYCSVDRYIGMFGIPGTEPDTMFGTHITHGLLHLLYHYVFRSRFHGGREYLGWFLCPREFSAENARLPASDDDTRWYPAVFVVWDQADDEANMACEAILLQGSRPWRGHVSRMWLSMSVTEARRQISQLDAMSPN